MTGTSLIARMADRRHLDPQTYYRTLKHTLMPSSATDEQIAAFLMVADRYGLDPLTREIYAFPNRKGTGITPVLSIDGWINLVNSHPQTDGFSFEYGKDAEGRLVSCTCTMHRRDRSHPISVTEFYTEGYRNTEPWNQMPARMLRHKAFKECARLAFGFAGIADEDEARDMSMPAPSTSSGVLQRADPIDDSVSPVVDALDAFASAPAEDVVNEAASEPDASPVTPGDDGSSAVSPPSPDAAADPSAPGEQAVMVLTRADAIDRLMAMATDPATTEQEKLESLDMLRPVYDDQLKPELVGAIFPVIARVMRGELAPAAAKKFLVQLKS